MAKFRKFKKGENLPKVAIDMVDSVKGWEYENGYCEAYVKDKGEKPEDWIVVIPGGAYKVGAKYMTWHTNPQGNVVGRCNWTKNALYQTILAIKKGEETPRDPNYQT